MESYLPLCFNNFHEIGNIIFLNKQYLKTKRVCIYAPTSLKAPKSRLSAYLLKSFRRAC